MSLGGVNHLEYDHFLRTLRRLKGPKEAVPLITIIEDDMAMQRLIGVYLKKVYPQTELRFYADPKHLLNKENKDKTSLYIIDINLPDWNGIGLAKYLRQLGTEDIPILFISADEHYESEVDDRFYLESKYTFLHKPFSDFQLDTKIKSLFGLRL